MENNKISCHSVGFFDLLSLIKGNVWSRAPVEKLLKVEIRNNAPI